MTKEMIQLTKSWKAEETYLLCEIYTNPVTNIVIKLITTFLVFFYSKTDFSKLNSTNTTLLILSKIKP